MIVLGLSGQYLHDSAACIVIDGRLIAYAEEERFCLKRHAVGEIPICSILHCIETQNLSIEDIDCIATSWYPDQVDSNVVEKLRVHPNLKGLKKIPVVSYGNHLSLAASSYFTSGFNKALIISANGSSENISTSIYYANQQELTAIKAYDVSQSLGYFYTAVGLYLGFDMWEEGKVMALSAYGNPVYDFPIHITEDGYKIDINNPSGAITNGMMQNWLMLLTRLFGVSVKPSYRYDKNSGTIRKNALEFTQLHKDIAASAQRKLEDVILNLIDYYTKKTGIKNVVITGGVAQNSTANGKIRNSGIVDEFFISPASNASGGCIGAAMLAYGTEHKIPVDRIKTAYWGPSFTNEEIEFELKKRNIEYRYIENISELAAELISKNYVVGWFQGKSEMGARSLGSRSIIANPADSNMHSRINNNIKFREAWRPVAASALDEERDWLLQDSCYIPFMLETFKATKTAMNQVSSIIHEDGTILAQTVRKEDNPDWYSMILHFYKLTGIPAVLHTSLNVKGKPICNTPAGAFDTFYSCGLDVLIIGNFIIEKKALLQEIHTR